MNARNDDPGGALERVAAPFQSDAAEIELRAPPPGVRATLYALLALLTTATLWAAFAEVDRVVVAPGKLVTTAPTLVVQPLETSVIRAIDVGVGARVRAGQTLARLDPTFTAADVGQLRAEVATLRAERDRLNAEVSALPYAPGDDAGPEARLQGRIHDQRAAEKKAKLAVFDEAIAGLTGGVTVRRHEHELLAQRLAGVAEVEDIRGALFDRQQGSKLNLLEARDTRLAIQREVAALNREIADMNHELASQRAQREAYLSEWLRDAAGELSDVSRRYEGAVNQLDKALRRDAMIDLKAPADAVVLEVAKRSVGSVVREAETLFTLVPLDVPLEAEVAIDARDIGHVQPDAAARIKIEAYPFQRHGVLRGAVRTISEDVFVNDGSGEGSRAGAARAPHYQARLTLESTRLDDVPDHFRLLPGMTVAAEIKAGRRTVLSYLLYPLGKALDESLREP